jgi:hypothetical protein
VSKKSIEKAINDYVRSETKGTTFQTGWILCVSLAPQGGDDSGVDSYITVSSEGLPAHTQMGLLQVAEMDLRNLSFLGAMSRVYGMIFGEENDGNGGEPF